MDWTAFKAIITSKKLLTQFSETDHKYNIKAYDDREKYKCSIVKTSPTNADQIDFETNYKPYANKPMSSYSQDGKPNVIASSRPNGTETFFTTAGDDVINGIIGEGKRMEWDFSNSDDEVTAPTGFKRKRMDLTFIDPIYIKEGTLYFHNAPKGGYGDCYIICPAGGYYYLNSGENAGALVQAAEPTVIFHYVNKHPIQGSVPMGDELNSEETQINPILPGYILRIEVTTLVGDNESNGVVEFESFRERTVVLE